MASVFGVKNKPRKKRSERPIQKAKKVIGSIVKVLHKKKFKDQVGIKTSNVLLGGSVGQGTAVTGHYDLDLVLYSKSIKYKDADENGYDNYLEKIEHYLEVELSASYTYLGKTEVALEFRYNLPEGGYLNVDLLLSPHWPSREQYFRDLALIKNRLRFSASASRYQKKFIKGQLQRVRELIRRAKAWRNVEWEREDRGRPKSYLISLLVIAAYNRLDYKSDVFQTLARDVGKEMKILVKEIATNDDISLIIPGTSYEVTTSNLLPECPRIIDPVNPANNVYLSGVGRDPYGTRGQGRWNMFREKVSTFDITSTADMIMRKMKEKEQVL